MDYRSIMAAKSLPSLAAIVVAGAALAISIAILPTVRAQEKGPPGATTVPGPHFEVASIRRSARRAGGGGFKSKEKGPPGACGGIGQGGIEAFIAAQRAPTRRLCLENRTLLRLIYDAYGIQGCPPFRECERVSGGPDWVRSEEFDVIASAPSDTPTFTQGRYAEAPHVREMLRTLLAERFGLRVHTETKEFAVYALTVARGGHKLTPNASPADGERGISIGGRGPGEPMNLGGTNVSMDQLTALLSSVRGPLALVDRPVVNRTGLEGTFDFRAPFAPDDSPAAATLPSLFRAMEQDLGLRMEPTRAPLEVLVIDGAEQPSEN